ncbi:alginate export family protein [Seongchinamella unica]|nr:alginate export family protein [Seongchinamella unica]
MTVSSKSLSIIAAAALGTCAVPTVAEESQAPGFTNMFSDGKTSFNFRYRYEYVDQDGLSRNAKASTLRSRLTFTSAEYRGLSFLAEFDDVTAIGSDNYNSTANGKVQYPVVADPEGTEVNQAWLKYAAAGASGTYGRQRILHGNQRFVGGVGWRQNEQTYDGFRAMYEGDHGFTVDYAYVYNINRIFGPDDGPAQPANHHGENHFLRADWKIVENHTVSAFYYGLDIDDDLAYAPGKTVGNSSDTVGVEYNGKFGPIGANASYATQSDAGDSPLSYDADYYLLEGSFAFSGLKASLGYEVLGAGDGVGFKTPYATLHKFQGWADMFLVTPGDGIEDLYVGLTGKLGPVALGGFYHDFSAEDSSEDWGTEIDLVATWNYSKNWMFQLKYASFSSDSDAYTDSDKAWVTVNFKI